MLQDLLQRLRCCEPEAINAFYNNLKRVPNECCGDCNYSWEIDATGYYLYGKSSVTYFRTIDGRVFRIAKWFHPNDCDMMQDIMQISRDTNDFRVEQLIAYDIVQYNGIEYMYTETARPNSELGIDGINDMLTTDTTTYFREFIDQYAKLLPHMDAMTSKYGLGPMMLSLHPASNRERDSIGHYWKNLRIFKLPTPVFVKESMIRLNIFTRLAENVKHEQGKVAGILEYAAEKWQWSGVNLK